jgi:hypothetical protein
MANKNALGINRVYSSHQAAFPIEAEIQIQSEKEASPAPTMHVWIRNYLAQSHRILLEFFCIDELFARSNIGRRFYTQQGQPIFGQNWLDPINGHQIIVYHFKYFFSRCEQIAKSQSTEKVSKWLAFFGCQKGLT